MTDQALEETEEVDGEESDEGEQEGSSRKKLSGKKLVLFIVLPIFVAGAGAAGVYYSGVADSYLGIEKSAEEEEAAALMKAVFFDLPEMLVNLNSSGRRTNFLKINISLELEEESDIKILELLMPRIVDGFQIYLRELRVDDLRGSAGMYRLREDLLRRINEVAKPVKINDILFKEMLIQ
ncbi:MAG: flagellar basal body-associated FliL family protein [Proteobacteria bacterium]|nr:flagellar basal body-associated FliL family protein [Pseudomonadota bacterium]